VKNLLLWLVIAAVLMTVFNSFQNRAPVSQPLAYSQFIADVKSGMVERVIIDDNVIRGKTTAGGEFMTYSPETDNKAMIGDLLNNGVAINALPPERPSLLMTSSSSGSRSSC